MEVYFRKREDRNLFYLPFNVNRPIDLLPLCLEFRFLLCIINWHPDLLVADEKNFNNFRKSITNYIEGKAPQLDAFWVHLIYFLCIIYCAKRIRHAQGVDNAIFYIQLFSPWRSATRTQHVTCSILASSFVLGTY